MAMKKRPAPQKETHKNDATVVYRAGAALLIACAILFGLQLVGRNYPLVKYFEAFQVGLAWSAGIFALIAVIGLVGLLGLRRKSRFWRAVSLPSMLLGIGLSLSCLLLYYRWDQDIPLLFFLCIAGAVLYLIWLLYQPEFFLLSLVNISAGGVFYCLSKYNGPATYAAILRIFLAVLTLGCMLLLFLAGKRDGELPLFGRTWRAISRGGTPLLLYITGAVWLVCLAAGIVLGPVLSYYCIFAAVAFELAAAVYYTMKLA